MDYQIRQLDLVVNYQTNYQIKQNFANLVDYQMGILKTANYQMDYQISSKFGSYVANLVVSRPQCSRLPN